MVQCGQRFIRIYSGRTPQEIALSDFSVVNRIGLKENLSPTRANGLASMIETIRNAAAAQLCIDATNMQALVG